MRRMLVLFAIPFLLAACSEKSTKPVGDTVPPTAVDDLLVTGAPGREVSLTWTAPGDDGTEGRAASYDIRCASQALTAETWDAATVLPSPPVPKPSGQKEYFTVTGLPLGEWHFALKAADDVPNWSALSDVASATVADVAGPDVVSDLLVISSNENSATLTWTAPGNDGMVGRAAVYDLRHAPAFITDETWESATPVQGVPLPDSAGTAESYTVTGLTTGQTYYFALKTADEVPHWSEMSNVTMATAVDVIPPAAVTDLGTSSSTEPSAATLRWTATGDDDREGTASEYDLRYASEPITIQSWDQAVRVQGVPAPSVAGTAETFTMTGLDTGLTYYFAIKVADEVPNWSSLSNAVHVGTLRRLTISMTGKAACPDWSRDGASIAFHTTWASTTNFEIYRIPAAGGAPVRLTSSSGVDAWPAWSPDGQKIAFSSSRGGHNGLYLIDSESGSNPTLLTSPDGQPSNPSWSPDGQYIAYDVAVSFEPPISRIYIVSSVGGTPVLLVDHPSINGEPTWSPDGTLIAFKSKRNGNSDIWVIPSAGGEATQLTTDPADDGSPSWSPDGTKILFGSWRAGNGDLYVMPAEGGEATQLTFDHFTDANPVWSPDGKQVAFESNRTGDKEIWILALE